MKLQSELRATHILDKKNIFRDMFGGARAYMIVATKTGSRLLPCRGRVQRWASGITSIREHHHEPSTSRYSLSLSLSLCVLGCNKAEPDKKGVPPADKKGGEQKPNAEKASLPKKDPAREAQLAAARDKKIQEAQKAEEKLIDGLKKAWTKFPPPENQIAIVDVTNMNSSVAIAPDATHLARVEIGPEFKVLELVTAKEKEVQTGHKAVTRLAVSPNGSLVVTEGLDHNIKIWDLPTGAPKKTLATQSAAPIVFSPDSKKLAFMALDRRLRIIDWETGAERDLGEGNGLGLAFSPNGELFAANRGEGDDTTMVLWDVASGGKIQEQKIGGSIDQIAFSPDGWTIAVAGHKDKATVQLWDLEKNSVGKTLLTGQFQPSIAYSPDGKLLVFSSLDGMVLLDPTSGKELRRLPGRYGEVTLFQGGSLLATRETAGVVRFWSVPDLLKSAPKN